MKNRRLITGLSVFFALIALVAYLGKPVAHYTCEASDATDLDFTLFRSGNFTILGRFLDMDDTEYKNRFSYAGTYRNDANTFDLDFTGLKHDQIEMIFKGTTAGGFVKNSDTYRINKNNDDGLNKVYLNGCLIAKK